MSICIDKKNKRYYISYQLKLPTGEFKTFNIRNKEWTFDLGKKFIKSIEQQEIEKDTTKRKLAFHTGEDITMEELVSLYSKEQAEIRSIGTAYDKRKILEKYLTQLFNLNKLATDILTIPNIEKFRDFVIDSNLRVVSKNNVIRVLREIVNFASEREYISYDLDRKLQTRLKSLSTANEEQNSHDKLKFWTNDEWELFISTFDDNDKWKFYFKTTYIAALRIGESIGLKWGDFYPDQCVIYIRRSIENSGLEKMPKNKSSVAPVSLPKELVEELVNFKEKSFARDEDYMFFSGHRTSKTTIRRVMNEHIKKSGVPKIGPHGLRHSCASRLINAGVSPLIVSKHLRHASVKETLDTYSHIFPSETEGLMDKIF